MNAGDPFSDEDGLNGPADLPAAEGNASGPSISVWTEGQIAPGCQRIPNFEIAWKRILS